MSELSEAELTKQVQEMQTRMKDCGAELQKAITELQEKYQCIIQPQVTISGDSIYSTIIVKPK